MGRFTVRHYSGNPNVILEVVAERLVRGMYDRDSLKESAERNLKMDRKKEEKFCSFAKVMCLVCDSTKVFVDGLRSMAGGSPLAEGFSASFTTG